ncbi:hypothetical protein [Nonomuraea endophytica]|uniref:hypothetical protein n=1 Tax=Nonomuraea endophytica TaxID=714136 RepID=UPI0037C6870B
MATRTTTSTTKTTRTASGKNAPARHGQAAEPDAAAQLADLLLDPATRQEREKQARKAAAQAAKQARKQLRSTLWRGRRMIRPILVMLGLQLAGWAQALLPMTLAFSLGFTVLAVIIAAAWARGVDRQGVERKMPVATLAGIGWLNLAAIYGPGGWPAAVLWIGGTLAAIPYWHRHKSAFIPAARLSDAEAELGLEGTREQQIWAARVAAPRKALTGSVLCPPAQVPGGWSAEIELVPGEQETETAIKATGKIASAFDVNASQITMDPPASGSNARARVTVIKDPHVLTRTRYLEREGCAIDLKTGIARVGNFADSQPAHWQFYSPTGGAQHGLIAGGTGGGKSGFIDTLLSLGHRCPAVVNVLLDPQGGQSQPDWNDHVALSAMGVENCMALLRKIDYGTECRAAHLGRMAWVDERGRERRGVPYLLPTGRPGDMVLLNLLVEEAPMLLKDDTYGGSNGEAVKLLGKGGRTWRKAGASENLVTQFPGLEDLIAQSLRSMLIAGGTVTSFRTGESVSQGMLGMINDPSKLPQYFADGSKTHGLGYIIGIDRRQASYRSIIPEDSYGIACKPPAGQLDEVTAGFFDDYDAQLRRAARTREVRTPTPPAPERATSGDVIAAVQKILTCAPDALDVASILHATTQATAGATLGDVKAALKTLEAEGRSQRHGDRWANANPAS